MAIGYSGSNGGIGEVYREVLVTDIDAGVSKYEALREKIPEEQREVRDSYSRVITGLKELRREMTKGLEAEI